MTPAAPRVAVTTLGCAKNVVDSERALADLAAAGFPLTDDPARADIVVLNTCGFIEPAREESIDTLLALLELRVEGRPAAVVLGGCLSVLHPDELRRSLPEVDRFVGLLSDEDLVGICTGLARELGFAPPAGPATGVLPAGCVAAPHPRLLTTPAHYAWLKIAEGCSNTCTFCTIPLIRGRTRSVPAGDLEAETRALAGAGVRELLLVAQDTTAWGTDLHPEPGGHQPELADLIELLGQTEPGPEWIRLMYTHPARISTRLIEVLADVPRVVPYLDVPVQSGSNTILRRMGRVMNRDGLIELFGRVRERIPGITLRTSLIVGFPGETEEDFEATLDLMRQVRFERLGVFGYSPETDTPAHDFTPRVAPGEIERRVDEVMALQEGISAARLAASIGDRLPVMLDDELSDLPPFSWIGRTAGEAPEVDGNIYLEIDPEVATDEVDRGGVPGLQPGRIVEAEIIAAGEHDREGVIGAVLS